MSSSNDLSLKWGVITFLDFLGWKGIWMNDYKRQSHEPELDRTSLLSLASLIDKVEKLCNDKSSDCTFISISDTMAIFTPCDLEETANYNMLKLHSEICSEIIDMSAREGFALRGAITIGKYACLKNIFVGPGVDECASWYDQTNWLGVIFAPSAQFVIDELCRKEKVGSKSSNNGSVISWSDAKIVKYKDIPVKNGIRGIKYCIAWGDDASILNKTLENTLSLSQDIAIKYINTNKYLYALRMKDDGNENK